MQKNISNMMCLEKLKENHFYSKYNKKVDKKRNILNIFSIQQHSTTPNNTQQHPTTHNNIQQHTTTLNNTKL